MSSLRNVSSRRLLALVGAVLALGALGAAIALAAGGGPVPPRRSLARALHAAATAPPVAGITARVSFTNHLIDASSLQGSDPLLSGASGRVWVGGGDRFRLELQSDAGDAQIVSDGRTLTVYDAASSTAYRVTLPGHPPRESMHSPPSLASITRVLHRLMGHVELSGAIPSDVAGQPAYTVRVAPKHDGGLLGRAELAWDAMNGVPLRAAIYARGSDRPVLELKATSISFGSVPASTFAVRPPAGTKIVTLGKGATPHELGARREHGRRGAEVTGAAAVAGSLPFRLSSPRALAGLPRQSVRKLDWKGHPAALVTYGKGLGAIVVVERPADAAKPADPSGGRDSGLTLPKVSIGGATGHELDTALGTVVTFERGGVAYIVAGSVPPVAAEAAARGL